MRRILSKVFFALVAICLFGNVNAQSGFTLGVGAGVLTGGDGFGMYLTPVVNLGYGKLAISGGPLVQKSDMHISGYQAKPMIFLSDSGYRRVRLYVFAQSMYNQDVHLSPAYNQILDRIEPELVNKADPRFRTFQQYAGVGLTGDNSRRIVLRFELGIGGYLNLEHEHYKSEIPTKFLGTRSNSDISMMFSMGMRVNLIRQKE